LPGKEASVLRQLINGFMTVIALCLAVGLGSSVAWSNVVGPATGQPYVTRADFDQAFADAAAASRPGNTPANRERLRNVGWKSLNLPLASK
jgi:hypothetical protein